VSGSTITSSVTHGITLGTVTSAGTYASPLTITGAGGVTASSGIAVYGPNTQAWTLANYGTILAGGNAVDLAMGGSVANTGAAALIQGYFGVNIGGGAGTVANSGTIIGTHSNAIGLSAGGTVDNTGAGLIQGYFGIYITGGVGTVANSGKVIGATANGIDLLDGGSVTNTGTGLIQGYFGVATSPTNPGVTTVTNSGTIIGRTNNGVALDEGGTVIDSGTISGGNGIAISFGGFGGSALTARLVLDPGYHLVGTVLGSTTPGATNTLELASAASAGTVSTVLATEFGNFGAVTVDPGARWTLTANNSLTGITLTDFGTLTNAGSLSGAGTLIVDPATLFNTGSIGLEVTLSGGGYLDNEAGATISTTGVAVLGTTAAPTIVNAGKILSSAGPSSFGIDLTSGGTIVNTGTILAPSALWTVEFGDGGFLSNSSSGYIGSAGIQFLAAGGTLVNAGQIVDTDGDGVTFGATGTVTNSGTISGEGGGIGVDLAAGGRVGNTGGLIQGYIGVEVDGATGTVTNSATIIGTGGNVTSGVALDAGGSVDNTGLIQGYTGVLIAGTTGTSGTVTNTGTIIGTGSDGVDLEEGGTVIDSGTISGGYAVRLDGSGGDLLVVEPGYKLVGGAYGGVSGTNTIELSGAVTATYQTLGLVHFQDLLFGAGGNETLKATNTSGTLGTVTISGFTTLSSGQSIDLTALVGGTLANGGTVNGSDQLVVSNGADTVTVQFNASDANVFKTVSGTGTVIVPACFCRGTLILTERGEVPVEDLAIGDRVVTLSGAVRRVKWIGRRAYDGRFVAANRRVLPIRIEAGALAPGLPARDLWLSPEHALYLDGALVPAGLLVNGATIRQVESVDRLEYFHIELERHDVILAEGVPAETFVDCDSRCMFQNAGEFAELYPDDLPTPWDFCAPRAEAGSAELAAVRAALLERADALGHDLNDVPAVAARSGVPAEVELAA
jgi:hypothetical protein